MSDDPKRRSGTTYLGTVPAGTVITPEIIQHLFDTQPRQPFDIEIKPNAQPIAEPDWRNGLVPLGGRRLDD